MVLWVLRDLFVQVLLSRAGWAVWDPETYGGWWPDE